MGWVVTWGGARYATEDFTLDELGRCELESDTPWSLMNPLRTAKVAKAFLGVVLDRAGVPEGETRESYLARLTLRQVKDIFTYEADEEEPDLEGERLELPLDLPSSSSGGSSSGASGSTAGPRRKRGSSGSATSSAS